MTTEELEKALEDLQNENEVLKEFLESIQAGKKKVATFRVGPSADGLYRFEDETGTTMILPLEPTFAETLAEPLEPGTKVLAVDEMVLAVLPEELELRAPTIEFARVAWEDVGGLSEKVEKIREAIEFPIKHPELMKEYGLKPPKGILLYGPPGCGKTLVAKAIATYFFGDKDPEPESFIYLKGAEILDRYVGVVENRIKAYFHMARMHYKKTGQRAVMFIDEAEAILNERGSRTSSDVDSTIVPTFLGEMDGLEDEGNPLIILATNFKDSLDKAVVREGRIDLKIGVTRPETQEDIAEIFAIHLSKVKTSEEVKKIAIEAASFFNMENSDFLKLKATISGALIQNIVQTAAQRAVRRALQSGIKTGIAISDIYETMVELDSSN